MTKVLHARQIYDCIRAAAEKGGIKDGGRLRWQQADACCTTGSFAIDPLIKPSASTGPVRESVCVVKKEEKEFSFLSCVAFSNFYPFSPLVMACLEPQVQACSLLPPFL